MSLNLERNDITSLGDIKSLSSMEKLSTLNLKDNSISAIALRDTPCLPVLQNVDLAFNAVATWDFVDALNVVFPNLKALRLSYNPLYTSLLSSTGKQLTGDDGYMLSLARIGTLTRFNYSEVCTVF